MTVKSSNTGADSAPATTQINTDLANGVASADSIVAERVQNLQWVHQARAAQLSRTAADLNAQYGGNDPGVKAATAAVSAANAAAARVSMVHQELATADPQVAQNGWALHGRVFDAQLNPVAHFTVFLVDATKTYQQEYGFAYTDDTGYFLVNYAGPDSASSEKSQAAAQAEAAQQLFVEIADMNAQPVYLSTTTFQPIAGAASYQNIVLPNGDQAIGDPPPEIRDVGLPAQKKKKKG